MLLGAHAARMRPSLAHTYVETHASRVRSQEHRLTPFRFGDIPSQSRTLGEFKALWTYPFKHTASLTYLLLNFGTKFYLA